ncbi:MAG: hypothetical protein GKS06_13765 [Acidobacteria bacterium]|nr:hypothetical protein [Acidobacteriota bacterium]
MSNSIAARITAAALALGAASPALAQQAGNLIVGGDFELEAVSLRLPEVRPFPLIMGGWGSRADVADAAIATSGARSGITALQIFSRPGEPAHAIQDVPLATPGYVFGIAVQRRQGRQSISLTGAWDRMNPGDENLVSLELRAATIRLRTPAGRWNVTSALSDGDWHDLELFVDPRRATVVLRIDGLSVGEFPSGRIEAPRTVILGSHGTNGASTFRYDDVTLRRLPEIELGDLQRLARASGDTNLTRRLDAARLALDAGAPRMMAAELRAAERLVGQTDLQEIAVAVEDLLALLEATR